ncbi:hypothetical protein CJD36_014840 [Flavipsychrobacter stenotrophus]|uniref:Uncharacterized protein n=1 Tax=Flavipsychrobacter stenotrophus TaxID=2077091 RepID=A0A2S7SST2_9BACT|nr:addiction module protein [Flavipsychrobacter stenotrophus]PQJ09973.1 hypothetical protein CJD36_014840 [Flavipsychrobacter stenotrophus]
MVVLTFCYFPTKHQKNKNSYLYKKGAVQNTYHIVVKKEYASAIIEDLQKLDAVELIPESSFEIPHWQIEEVLKRKEYYKLHPEELVSWEDAQKMIKVD